MEKLAAIYQFEDYEAYNKKNIKTKQFQFYPFT